jgi:hypothetical protein
MMVFTLSKSLVDCLTIARKYCYGYIAMNKKIIIPFIVSVSGLMIGVILSSSFQKKPSLQEPASSVNQGYPLTQPTTSSSIENNNIISANELELRLTVTPNPLKAFDASLDYRKDWDKIDKARIIISYKNNSGIDFEDMQVWIKADSEDILYSGTNTTKQDTDLTSKIGRMVYDIPDIKAGEANGAEVVLFSSKPGTYQISAEIHTKDNKTTPAVTTSITVH